MDVLSHYKRYGFLGFCKLVTDILFSKLWFKSVRIIRSPSYIRGKNCIDFGSNLTTGINLRLDAFPSLVGNGNKVVMHFGNNVQLNDYVHIAAVHSISIADNVLVASNVFITDHNHGNYSGIEIHCSPDTAPNNRPLISKPVEICENVWIGEHVVILPGVTIGRGSIIGAMSVVNSDIPPKSIAVGSPARVVKTYNENNKQWERVDHKGRN